MRNLKRVLSLALACVMVIGMMVMTTGAADLTDYDEITYTEAVDVAVALGLIKGNPDGSFNPDGILTRAGAAKLICYMLMGPANAEKLTATQTFTDVKSTYWAAPYISYCVSLGYIAGNGDGTFNPDGKLTGVAFAKLLLCALGYDPEIEGYVNNKHYATNIGADAIEAGLNIDGVDMAAQLTREQAAQMILNTLEANMVKYTNKGTTITVEGVDVVIGASEAETVYSSIISNQNIFVGTPNADTEYSLQFAEKHFPALIRDVTGLNCIDGMGRPSHTWRISTDVIGEYSHIPTYTYVINSTAPWGTPKAADLIDKKLGKNVDDTPVDGDGNPVNPAYVNGGSNDTTANTALKVGDIVEVYVDIYGDVYRVAVTRYDVDVVTGAVALKGKGAAEQVRVPGVLSYTSTAKVFGYEDLAAGDVVYKYTDADGVTYLAAAESFDGKLTSINNANPNTYVVDDETYTANGNMTAEAMNMTTPVFNTGYRFWTDNNGYVIYGAQIEEVLSDYVIVQDVKFVDVDDNSGLEDDSRLEARLVIMDGTTKVVTISSIDGYKPAEATGKIADLATGATHYVKGATGVPVAATAYAVGATSTAVSTTTTIKNDYYVVLKDDGTTIDADSKILGKFLAFADHDAAFIDNVFFTYTVNFKGEYALTTATGFAMGQTEIAGGSELDLEAGKVFDGTNTIPVTDDTVFIVAKRSNGDSFDTFTGKYNAPNLTTATGAYVTKNGVVTHMYIDSYDTKTITGNTVFFLSAVPNAYYEIKTAVGSYGYHTYDAIVNGEFAEVKVSAKAPAGSLSSANNTLATGSDAVAVDLFVPTYDTNGVITNLDNTGLTDDAVKYGYKLTGTTLVTGKNGVNDYDTHYVCANDTVAYFIDVDYNMEKLYIADLANDANDNIYVVKTNNTDSIAAYAVVFEMDADETGTVVTVDGTKINVNANKSTITVNGVDFDNSYVATGSAGVDIDITTAAGAVVKYSNDGTWYDADEAWDTVVDTDYISDATGYTISAAAAGTYNIVVIADDGAMEHYQITLS